MTYNRGGIMFYKVAEWCSLITGYKGWRGVLFRKILYICFKANDVRGLNYVGKFCTSASRLTISGGLKKPADL